MADNCHRGHRARMREKLSTYGPRIFETYELLEMLLYYVIPYADTNPISKRLLSAFGSLSGVLSADHSELIGIEGIGERCAALLNTVGRYGEACELSRGRSGTVLDSHKAAGKLLVDYFENNTDVNILLLLLDNGMRLSRIVPIAGDNFASGAVRSRPFIAAALDCGASVAIIGYTHRGKVAFPYDGDRVTAAMLRDDLSAVGVNLAETFVIGGGNFYSLNISSRTVALETRAMSAFYESAEEYRAALGVAERRELSLYSEGDVYEDEGQTCAVCSYLCELLSFTLGEKAEGAARRLGAKFGDVSVISSVCEDELCAVGEMPRPAALLLKLVAYASSRMASDELLKHRRLSKDRLDILINSLFSGSSVETVWVILFGKDDKIVGCKCLGEGTVNASDIYPRRIAELAIRTGACGVLIAHNHPLGLAEPSSEDIEATLRLHSVLRSSGVHLLSHVVVADREVCVITPKADGGVEIGSRRRVTGNLLTRS